MTDLILKIKYGKEQVFGVDKAIEGMIQSGQIKGYRKANIPDSDMVSYEIEFYTAYDIYQYGYETYDLFKFFQSLE